MKRLVLLFGGYLQKNNVTGFCYKSREFCNSVTSCEVLSLKVSPNVLGRPDASPPRPLAHSRAHSHARSDYYDVFQTHTTSTRLEKYRRKKATFRWLGGNPRVYLSSTVSLKPSRDSRQWSRIVAANSVRPSMRA